MKTKTYTNGHNLETGEKLPPQDIEAERALIACLITDPDAIYEVSAIIKKDDFYLAAYGLVFEAVQRVSKKGERPDIVNIMAELRALGHADIGNGQNQAESFLLETLTSQYFTFSVSSYARTVSEMATRRRLILASRNIAIDAWDEKKELPEVMEAARQNLFTVSERASGRGLSHVSVSMAEYMELVEERSTSEGVPGLVTGLHDLDKALNGLQKKRLIVIAARPGMGKTALMLAMADGLSVERQKRGAIYSLEMGKGELINRLMARRIRVETQRLDNGKLTDQEWEPFYSNSGKISQAPLFIDDRPGLGIAEIRAQAMRQAMETGLDYIMVDYLGLVTVPGTKSRYEQVSEAARFFKNLSKEIDVPVIVASQLSRALEARGDKRPQLSDLRDSGEIEEAADIVLSIYRDDYYNPDTSERPNIGEIEALKHRNGSQFVVDLYWHAHLATYRNLQRQEINF